MRSRQRIRDRFNLRAGVSDGGASTSALLLLLLTRLSRQLPLLSGLMIVWLRHEFLVRSRSESPQSSRIQKLSQVRRLGSPTRP
jgi:hypothetical protein